MAEERLDLIKGVFDKIQYIKTINTSFNELGTTTVNTENLNQVDKIILPKVRNFAKVILINNCIAS